MESSASAVTCVVLAAGRARRMGSDKLSLAYGSGTVLDAVLAACAAWPVVVVGSPELAERLSRSHPGVTALANDAPERGMVHSLRLANEAIPPERSIAVLLGDKPLATPELVGRIAASGDSDVVYPRRGAVPGHPVLLSPAARRLIGTLPDGDGLNAVRDDPRLSRTILPLDDDGAYVDIDTPEDYRSVLERLP